MQYWGCCVMPPPFIALALTLIVFAVAACTYIHFLCGGGLHLHTYSLRWRLALTAELCHGLASHRILNCFADFLGSYMLVLTVSLHFITEPKAGALSTACSPMRMTFHRLLRPEGCTEESIMIPTHSKLLADFLGMHMLVLTVSLHFMTVSKAGALSIVCSLTCMTFAFCPYLAHTSARP